MNEAFNIYIYIIIYIIKKHWEAWLSMIGIKWEPSLVPSGHNPWNLRWPGGSTICRSYIDDFPRENDRPSTSNEGIRFLSSSVPKKWHSMAFNGHIWGYHWGTLDVPKTDLSWPIVPATSWSNCLGTWLGTGKIQLKWYEQLCGFRSSLSLGLLLSWTHTRVYIRIIWDALKYYIVMYVI